MSYRIILTAKLASILIKINLITLKNIHLKALLLNTGLMPQLFFFSLFTNLLLLIPSWYMLEVYDRVLMSRNINTLMMLGLISLALLGIMELLNKVRIQLLSQIGNRLLIEKRESLFDLVFLKGVKTNQPFNPSQLDHLNKLATFISSIVFLSILDLPFSFGIFRKIVHTAHGDYAV